MSEFNVACPSCSAIFSVPVELAGEMAECAECGAVFEIPHPPEPEPVIEGAAAEDSPEDTKTGPVTGVASDGEGVTNTVRLSRTSIGMIPQMKDSFQFDKPAEKKQVRPPAPKPSAAAAPPKPSASGGGGGKKKFTKSRPSIKPPPRSAAQQEADPAASTPEMAAEFDAGASGDKSPLNMTTALLLCLFLGWVGAHRFYAGKAGTGVAMLFTLGGLGIWALIDLISIATGKFKDKTGLPIKS